MVCVCVCLFGGLCVVCGVVWCCVCVCGVCVCVCVCGVCVCVCVCVVFDRVIGQIRCLPDIITKLVGWWLLFHTVRVCRYFSFTAGHEQKHISSWKQTEIFTTAALLLINDWVTHTTGGMKNNMVTFNHGNKKDWTLQYIIFTPTQPLRRLGLVKFLFLFDAMIFLYCMDTLNWYKSQ